MRLLVFEWKCSIPIIESLGDKSAAERVLSRVPAVPEFPRTDSRLHRIARATVLLKFLS